MPKAELDLSQTFPIPDCDSGLKIYSVRKGPFGIFKIRDVYIERNPAGEITAILEKSFGNIENGNLVTRVALNAFFGLFYIPSGQRFNSIYGELTKGGGLREYLRERYGVPEGVYDKNIAPLIEKL